MDRRRRAAALAGSTAAIAAGGSVAMQHNIDTSYFLFGLVVGIAVAILIVAAVLIRRGGKTCARG